MLLQVQSSLGVLLPHDYGGTSHDSRINLSADGASQAIAIFFTVQRVFGFEPHEGNNNKSAKPKL